MSQVRSVAQGVVEAAPFYNLQVVTGQATVVVKNLLVSIYLLFLSVKANQPPLSELFLNQLLTKGGASFPASPGLLNEYSRSTSVFLHECS